jgi:hypothetical protein
VRENIRPVRLAYQPSTSSTFLSEQPPVLLSQNKPAPAISHQPNEQVDCGLASGWWLVLTVDWWLTSQSAANSTEEFC